MHITTSIYGMVLITTKIFFQRSYFLSDKTMMIPFTFFTAVLRMFSNMFFLDRSIFAIF